VFASAVLLAVAGLVVSTLLIWWQAEQTEAAKTRAEANLSTAYEVLEKIWMNMAERRLPVKGVLRVFRGKFLETYVCLAVLLLRFGILPQLGLNTCRPQIGQGCLLSHAGLGSLLPGQLFVECQGILEELAVFRRERLLAVRLAVRLKDWRTHRGQDSLHYRAASLPPRLTAPQPAQRVPTNPGEQGAANTSGPSSIPGAMLGEAPPHRRRTLPGVDGRRRPSDSKRPRNHRAVPGAMLEEAAAAASQYL
jgi:hypothetical protein